MLSEAFIGKAGEKKPPGRGVFQTGTKHLSRMIKVQDSLGTSVTLFFVMSYLRLCRSPRTAVQIECMVMIDHSATFLRKVEQRLSIFFRGYILSVQDTSQKKHLISVLYLVQCIAQSLGQEVRYIFPTE